MRKLPISSLGLITSTASAATITSLMVSDSASFSAATAHADAVTVLGFQWVSGTINIGDSTVTTGGVGTYVILDTTTRTKEFRSTSNTASLPIRDFYCVGVGTFIVYYQVE